MITQKILNNESNLGKKIYIYYLDKMSAYLSIGSDEYIKWYKDLCLLYYLSKGLNSIKIIGDKLYLGNIEISETVLESYTYSIREYLSYEIGEIVFSDDDDYNNDDDDQPLNPPITINNYYIQDWRAVIIDVPTDDVETLTLPFLISEVDPESIRITVNDNDPIHLVQPNEEGVHIIGSTLYWHTYYNLKAGDRVFVQYLTNLMPYGI